MSKMESRALDRLAKAVLDAVEKMHDLELEVRILRQILRESGMTPRQIEKQFDHKCSVFAVTGDVVEPKSNRARSKGTK